MKARDHVSLLRIQLAAFKLRRALEGQTKVSLVLDVDGVFTDGTFMYSSKGKVKKAFGAHDSESLQDFVPLAKVE